MIYHTVKLQIYQLVVFCFPINMRAYFSTLSQCVSDLHLNKRLCDSANPYKLYSHMHLDPGMSILQPFKPGLTAPDYLMAHNGTLK